MGERILEKRIKKVFDRYSDLISAASTDEEKEKLMKELDLVRRDIYFGAEMKKHRDIADKSRDQLGKEIGRSASYVKQVESGTISLQNKPEMIDKVVKSIKWSRRDAYNMLGIEYDRLTETMTLSKAKEAFATALVDSKNANQFILQVLNIRTNFEMDFRQKMPGEFLKSQEIASIFFNIEDMSPEKMAEAFLKIGVKAKLSQKQWERVFRICKKDVGENSLAPVVEAFITVVFDEKTAQRIKEAKLKANHAKTLELNLDDWKALNIEIKTDDWQIISKETSAASTKNLKRDVFFILNEFFADLLDDEERETFMKLMDSIEGRS